eukprot:1158030-Pelagomonas_calceolata.AAC.8
MVHGSCAVILLLPSQSECGFYTIYGNSSGGMIKQAQQKLQDLLPYTGLAAYRTCYHIQVICDLRMCYQVQDLLATKYSVLACGSTLLKPVVFGLWSVVQAADSLWCMGLPIWSKPA